MLVILTSFSHLLYSQNLNIYGYWVGKVNIPMAKLTTIFEIRKTGTSIDSVFLSIPEQGAKDLPDALLGLNKDSIIIFHNQINRTFYGEFLNDSTVKGDWKKIALVFQ